MFQPKFQDGSNSSDVATKWQKIVNAANNYPYAEADGFTTPSNFPDSRYFLPPGNNSNSFVRWLLKQVDMSKPDLSASFRERTCQVMFQTTATETLNHDKNDTFY